MRVRRKGRQEERALACVLGEIDLVRALALAGIPVAAVARRGQATLRSRATAVRIEKSAAWSSADLADNLAAWAADRPRPPVIFYDNDADLLLLSTHRERLARHAHVLLPPHDLVLDLVDKARFTRLAIERSLPVPVATMHNPGDGIEVDVPLPAVVKPITRNTSSWTPLTAQKAIQVDTRDELRRALESMDAAGLAVVVQELVPGPETLIESYHVFAYEGQIVGEFTGAKIRTFPTRHGYSTSLVTTDAPDVRTLGRDLLERVGFDHGVAKLDFKRRPSTGQLALLEVNPRFSLWHHLGAKAGVNLAAAVYARMLDRPVAPFRPARAGVRWCNLPSDLRAVRAGGGSVLRWLPWALGAEAKHALAWDDPAPFVVEVVDGLKAMRRRPAQV